MTERRVRSCVFDDVRLAFAGRQGDRRGQLHGRPARAVRDHRARTAPARRRSSTCSPASTGRSTAGSSSTAPTSSASGRTRSPRLGHGPDLPERRAVRQPHRAGQPDAGPAHTTCGTARSPRSPGWAGPGGEELAARAAVEDIVDFLELEQWRRLPVGLLPYGVQKRVELGRALAMEPKLLLLDEPVGGHEPRGDRGHGPLHPRHPRRAGHPDHPGRARHGPGDGPRRPGAWWSTSACRSPPAVPAEIQHNPDVIRAYLGEVQRDMTATRPAGRSRSPPGATTIATRVRDRARRMRDRVAMREKDLGIWQEVTWAVLLGHRA